jgi:hypothetical protein
MMENEVLARLAQCPLKLQNVKLYCIRNITGLLWCMEQKPECTMYKCTLLMNYEYKVSSWYCKQIDWSE